MSLDLNINIKANSADAKRELASVEKGIKSIEGASKSAQPAVSKVADALKQTAEGSGKVNTAAVQMTQSTKAYENAALKAATAVGLLNAGQAQQVKAATAAAGAIGLSTAAVTALAGGLLVAASALVAVISVLGKAATHYIQTSHHMTDTRVALAALSKQWEQFQNVVGGALLGDASFVRPITMLNIGLALTAQWLAKNIEDMKTMLSLGKYLPGRAGVAFDKAEWLFEGDGQQLGPQRERDYLAELDKAGATMPNLTGRLKEQYEAAKLAGESVDELTRRFGLSALQQKIYEDRTKAATKAQEEQRRASELMQKQAEKEAEARKKAMDAATGQDAIDKARDMMSVLEAVGGVTKVSADWMKQLGATVNDAVGAFIRLGQQAPQAMLQLWAGIQKGNTIAPAMQQTMLPSTLGGIIGPQMMLPFSGEMSESTLKTFVDYATKAAETSLDAWQTVWADTRFELPNMLLHGLANGAAGFADVASHLGNVFSTEFQQRVADSLQFGAPNLSTGSAVMGGVGMGIGTALGGYALGKQYGKVGGTLAGAGSGAAAGAMFGSVVPGIGTAVGAGVGALIGGVAGFFGGRSKEKEQREQMQADREQWIQQYGGMEKLKQLAGELGVSLGNVFTTKKPEEFAKVVERMNGALEKQQKLFEGVGTIISGVNARAQVFNETVKATDADEFNRLGTMAFASFGAYTQTHGNPLGALEAMKPTLDAISAAQKEYNFTASESVQRLLDINNVVKANSSAFQALAADGQILQGAMQANWKDFDLFRAVSQDVVAQINKITDNGVPMSQALALNQPVLQSLWEAQQKFKFETDEATTALINQAKEQGLVGEHMKSVNEQILDVLLAIGKVLGADIPDALRRLPDAAEEAAAGMNAAFDTVVGPSIRGGNVSADDLNYSGDYYAGSGYAGGGGSNNSVVVNVTGNTVRDDRDLDELTEQIVQRIPRTLTRAGI